MTKYLSLILCIIVFEVISFFIGQLTQSGVDSWYEQLVSPPFTPPNIVFPVAWTTLYALIASAGWVLWQARNRELLYLFTVYMALNWSWSFIFFSLQLLATSFIWIIMLNLVSLILIVRAWPVVKPAAWLMILPLFWTIFAAYLAGGYWLLNQ